MKQLLPRQLKNWLDDPNVEKPILIDIRSAEEFELCSIPNSISVPDDSIYDFYHSLDPYLPMVVVCHGFDRSVSVALFLERKGFLNVSVLIGGIDAWAMRVDQTMPRYK
ncbi:MULTISPECIES: rhodanese-like domain-containing protein [Candidatus Ichthyocystis]|uniref:Putative sulphurtransferase, Rhodanese-like domain n=1 Tax=Candidatus Ichthyocystis hellenicum TaxID=1561003 RepID=A0A0S4M332_9BURK|nr:MULTISPECIES: rhodanese-like domain-containing protein [Ichthyocystis]CUT17388.1 putative sulphurtransferase, Rhodanese-like domain [Candidatus Ichthyocystis hellenicum]